MQETNLAALWLMVLAYFVLILLAPTLGLLTATALWFLPLRPARQRQLLWLFRVLNSWNSTNVLCATIWVMSLQVDLFFDVIADNLAFCPTQVGSLLAAAGAAPRDAVCFGVHTRIEPGWYFFAGFVVYSFLLSRALFFFLAKGREAGSHGARDQRLGPVTVLLM